MSDGLQSGYRELERWRDRAVLGIRFWDQATETPVRHGLIVTARPLPGVGVTRATPNGDGVYCFSNLPGFQKPDSLDDTVPSRSYRIDVYDPHGRFLPVAMTVEVPVTEPGLFLSPWIDPDDVEEPARFYLFSAPARGWNPEVATVRARLWDRRNDVVAAYAVLEVTDPDGNLWVGVSDETGGVALQFPYPTVRGAVGEPGGGAGGGGGPGRGGGGGRSGGGPGGGSGGGGAGGPPGEGTGTPLHQQTWALSVRVRYEPEDLTYPGGSPWPDLQSVLGQRLGYVVVDEPHRRPRQERSWEFPLTFGRELILRTGERSELWIDPARRRD